MDQVLEHLEVWGSAGASLLCGGALVIVAMTGCVQERRISRAGRSVLLSAGMALMVVGLLHLLDLVSKEWFWVNWSTALGILFILEGISARPVFLTVRTYVGKRLSVVLGLAMMSCAVLTILRVYRY